MPTLRTLLHIYTEDAQGYTERLTVGVTPASFGATTLPTEVQIEAFVDAIFNDAALSTNIVTGWGVEVREFDSTGHGGGTGIVATSIAAKTRQQIGVNPDPDGWEVRIPGLNKANVLFDPTNPNAITTAGALFDAIRTAAVAIGFKDPSGVQPTAPSAPLIMETAVAFNGKRGPKRPR